MTTTQATPLTNPPRWAPDPEVRSRVRWWDGTRWTEHTADVLEVTRPPLPSWFGRATTGLYAVCGLVALALLGVFALSLALSAGDPLIGALASLLTTVMSVVVLFVGGWAHMVSGSSHVDPTALHRDRVWLLVAWFVPVISVIYPRQLFGEIWASAHNVRTRRTGQATSLVAPRPWVIGAWAWAWGVSAAGVIVLFFIWPQVFMQTLLITNAVAILLLAGVIRVIARELKVAPGGGRTPVGP